MYKISLIESSLIENVDLLIDICLKSNVSSRLDYSCKELILRDDRESCFQYFLNLREGKEVFQDRYVLTENGQI